MEYQQLPSQYQQIQVPYPGMHSVSHGPPTPLHHTSYHGGYAEIQQPQPPPQPQRQIYTAVYSGVHVYEVEVNGVAVMRRRSDGWLNATQILKVAGVDKGKRTKILEKEILPGEHEKIQGGYGKYQGTWISYARGREFCRQYAVEELLRPLLDYDLAADGTTNAGSASQVDTPTKEQALAANRKRMLNPSVDHRMNGHAGNNSNNTFFQNISPTASNALAAMSKTARYDSPIPPRPGNAHSRLGSMQQQMMHGQQYSAGPSQQSFMSDAGDSHNQAMYAPINSFSRTDDGQEPPRKRVKASQEYYGQVDPSIYQEENMRQQEAMAQAQYAQMAEQGPYSLPPLISPTDKAGEERRLALLDLFADSQRTDFSQHPAILHLAGQDLDTPLDASANTALHWAATLARVGLMRLLIARGANIFRGNAAGQTALMAIVQVNNSLDQSCFPEMLEVLGPLIEVRDATGRTVLHHIAVSSGIKGRAQSSRYYLESLLEFVVRKGGESQSKSISLSRFIHEVVNVQDKSGNTALNLVARIGNHPIIKQLDELGADFTIPNHHGMRPTDFGLFPQKPEDRSEHSQQAASSSTQTRNVSGSQASKASTEIDQIREEIVATTTSILTQTLSQYTAELSKHQALLDQQNAALRAIAQEHKQEQKSFDFVSAVLKDRNDRARKIDNIRQANAEARLRLQQRGVNVGSTDNNNELMQELATVHAHLLPPDAEHVDDQHHAYLTALPATPKLRARLNAFSTNNAKLEHVALNLKARSLELEQMYRRVISICTGTEEERVPEVVDQLLQAVESEEGGKANGAAVADGETGALDVGRVRDFLRKAEAVAV